MSALRGLLMLACWQLAAGNACRCLHKDLAYSAPVKNAGLAPFSLNGEALTEHHRTQVFGIEH